MFLKEAEKNAVQIFAVIGQEKEKSEAMQVLQDSKRDTGGPCTRTQCSLSRGRFKMFWLNYF